MWLLRTASEMSRASPKRVTSRQMVTSISSRNRNSSSSLLLRSLSILILLCRPAIVSGVSGSIKNSAALLIVDVQNCFMSNGSLAVCKAESILPVINEIRSVHNSSFEVVVMTMDWHCPDHVSFASQHLGHDVYEKVNLTYLQSTGELCESESTRTNYTVNCSGRVEPKLELEQTLWQDHCVMNTTGAELSPGLDRLDSDVIIKKGYNCQIDAYSGFYDNGALSQTPLNKILTERGVKLVFVAGLTFEYCAFHTAADAKKLGYDTYVIEDATGAVADWSKDEAKEKLKRLGIKLIHSSDLGAALSTATRTQAVQALLLASLVLHFSTIRQT